MPITLPPLGDGQPSPSRRRFLAASLAAGVGLAGARLVGAAGAPSATGATTHPTTRAAARAAAPRAIDADRFALLSDPHIDADPSRVNRGVNMTDHMLRACDELVALPQAPAAVLVNGDCAHLLGRAEDYARFLTLLDGVRAAGMPVHANAAGTLSE